MACAPAAARSAGRVLRRIALLLLSRLRLLRSLDDARREVSRGNDLQHLEILRASDLAMLDTGCLQDDITFANGALALALVFEGRPAVHDEHELERAVMDMPFLHLVLHLLPVVANDVGNKIALGAILDAEIAVLEDLA